MPGLETGLTLSLLDVVQSDSQNETGQPGPSQFDNHPRTGAVRASPGATIPEFGRLFDGKEVVTSSHLSDFSQNRHSCNTRCDFRGTFDNLRNRITIPNWNQLEMSTSVQEHAILMSLESLFEEASGKGLWFFHESIEAGEIWCSPEYLRAQQAKGAMVWAPEHWELRSPGAYLKKLSIQAEATVKEYNEMAARLKESKRLRLASLISNDTEAGTADSA